VDIPRPARTLNLTAKLKDAANTETPQLSFQRKAVQDFHSQQANQNWQNNPPASLTAGANSNAPSSASAVPTLQNKCDASSGTNNKNGEEDGIVDQPATCMSSSYSKLTFSLGAFFTAKKRNAPATVCQAKRRCAMLITSDNIDMTDIDAEGDIRHKGMVFLNLEVQQLN